MISDGPPGRRAIVKWKPATKVPAGVYLVCESHEIINLNYGERVLTSPHMA